MIDYMSSARHHVLQEVRAVRNARCQQSARECKEAAIAKNDLCIQHVMLLNNLIRLLPLSRGYRKRSL